MAPTIVALHGFTGCGSDFKLINESWEAPGLEDTFEGNRERLKEYGEGFYLLGYSMGGRVALDFAVKHGDRLKGLILVGATAGIEDSRKREQRHDADVKLASRVRELGTEAFLEEWGRVSILASQQSFLKSLLPERKAHKPEYLAQLLEGIGTGSMESLWDKLGDVKCPVLLLTGGEDRKFTKLAERMVTRFFQGEHEVIEGVGHGVHLEAQQVFLEKVENFIEKTTKMSSL